MRQSKYNVENMPYEERLRTCAVRLGYNGQSAVTEYSILKNGYSLVAGLPKPDKKAEEKAFNQVRNEMLLKYIEQNK